MKANGAPEKIYLSQERDEDGYYVDLMWHKHPYKDMENIQYVRTDAFIDKALAFIRSCTTYDGLGYKAKCVNIDDFRKYMKGE